MNTGSAAEWDIKNDGKKVNVLWALILHNTSGFVAYTKKALAKSIGRREELGRRMKEKKGQDATEGIPSRLGKK